MINISISKRRLLKKFFFPEKVLFFLISQNLLCNFFTLKTISDYSVELNYSVHEHDKLKFPVPGELTITKRGLCLIWQT